MTLRTALLLLLAICPCLLPGCGFLGGDSSHRDGTKTVELLSHSEGPVKVTVTSSTDRIQAGKTATLTLRVEADAGVSVQLDDYAKALETSENRFEYRVVQSRLRPPVKTATGRIEWSNEYDMEFILAGDYELPPVSLTALPAPIPQDAPAHRGDDEGDRNMENPHEPTEIKTERIKVLVHETGAGGLTAEELQQIPTLSPVELPGPWHVWRWVIAAALLAAFALAFVGYRRWNRMRAGEIIVIPAHEWARREIARLLADDLIARDRRQEYFYRLSDIVRGYIERRFSVAAPEMTTEEFFRWMSTDRRFDPKDREELVEFMNACDVVKYARHEPTSEEARLALDRAVDYIERTRERLVGPAAAPDEQVRERAA